MNEPTCLPSPWRERGLEPLTLPSDAYAVRVARRVLATPDIAVFDLVPAGSSPLPSFEAGSHVEVLLPMGPRQYSLCSPSLEGGHFQIAVQREAQGRGGSRLLVETVQVGDRLWLRGPCNLFALEPGAHESVLLAGGIGITPVLAMAWQLAAQGRSFSLHYSGRALSRMALVETLLTSPWADRVRIYADDGLGAPRLNLADAIGLPLPGRHLYLCGPSGMIEAARRTAGELGWPDAQLHWEHFGAPQLAVDVLAAQHDAPFELEIASTGQRIAVPADQTAAQALEAAGVPVNVSCGAGVCGQCRVRVLAGRPDHRDYCLSPAERDEAQWFTPCCSRAFTPSLRLEL